MGFYRHNLYLAFNFFVFRLAKLIVQIFGARALPVASFGLFSYLYSLMDIWVHLFGFGLDIAASRAHGLAADWRELWKKAAFWKLLLSVLGALIGLIALPWPYSLIFGVWHIGFMQSKLAYSLVNTLLYPKGLVIAGFAAETVLVAVALLATKIWGLAGFVSAFALERAVEALGLWRAATLREPALAEHWNCSGMKNAARRLFPGASWLWANQLLGILAARLDIVLVKMFLGLESLALYSLSFRLAEAPLFLFAAMADSTFAYFVRHRKDQESLYAGHVKKALVLGFVCAAALTAFAFLGAGLVLGPKYAGIAPFLAAYSWVLVLRGANMVSSSFLAAAGREKALLASSAAGVGFSGLRRAPTGPRGHLFHRGQASAPHRDASLSHGWAGRLVSGCFPVWGR
ncbi:MAG: oligosaccharide flippase family protein [Elusimicrobia bacterium]|nr:oligosaccharide flippase family protein [Elusimicrobiota bacterium]